MTLGFVIVIKATSSKLSWISMNTGAIPDPAGGGALRRRKGWDARRLAYGCKFRILSHLGCSGQNVIIFSREGLV